MEEAARPTTEGLFMDVEELELLQRYHTDNPSFLSFTDTDERTRTLEERLVECDLEKVIKKCHALLRDRRQLLTRDQAIQTLPLQPTVPTMLQLRGMRNSVIEQWSEFPHQATFVGVADVLAKEVALSQESRNTLPFVLNLMSDHFRKQCDMLACKAQRYISRWNHLLTDAEAIISLNKPFADRLRKVHAEYEFCQDALRVIDTYSTIFQANLKAGSRSDLGGENAADHVLQAAENDARIAEELMPSHFRAYIARFIFDHRARKKYERFASRARMIPQHKRYEIHSTVMTHLCGGFAAEGSEASNGVPLALRDETDVLASLADLCACFRVPTPDQSNMQQFLYHAGKKYTAVFESQVVDWQFSSFAGVPQATSGAAKGGKNAQANSSNTAADGSNSGAAANSATQKQSNSSSVGAVKTFLRESSWTKKIQLRAEVPGWQQRQDALLASATSTDGEARTLLKAEINYLGEQDMVLTVNRWKSRADTFARKIVAARHGKGSAGPNGNSKYDDDDLDLRANSPASLTGKRDAPLTGHALTLYQRLSTAMQLRYLRVREFRRRLLSTLNYFASVLRMIARDADPDGRVISCNASKTQTMKAKPLICDPSEELTRAAMTPMVTADLEHPTVDPDTFTASILGLYDNLPQGPTAPNTGAATDAHGNDVDSYEPNSSNGTITVRRGDGVSVMDTWALEELQKLEAYLLLTGAYYVGKHNSEVQTIEVAGQLIGSPLSTSKGTTSINNNNVSMTSDHQALSGASVDYCIVIEDLFESETWFSEAKMKALDSLRECYEHATVRSEQSALAKQMLQVISQRPRLDLTDAYFTTSYTREVVNLELRSTVTKEIIQSMISEERKIASSLNPPISVPKSASAGVPPARGRSQSTGDAFSDSLRTSVAAGGSSSSTVAAASSGAAAAAAGSGVGFTPSESTILHAKLSPQFGLPDATIQDTRLFFPLFSASQVVNILDVYESLGVLESFSQIVEHGVASIAQRFNLIHNAAAVHIVEREVLQEMLLQWRVLNEEDRIARNVVQKSAAEAEVGTENAIDSITAIDQVVQTLLAEEDSLLSGKQHGNANAATASSPSPAAEGLPIHPLSGAGGRGNSRALPLPSRHVVALMNVIELLSTRRSLMTALYETEMYYTIHRRQAKMMGVSVRRGQLDPIDFETRRAFAQVDDLEQIKESSNPLEDVLSVKAEMLCNLSIAEFDSTMAQFDLASVDGIRRLLQHGMDMFLLANTVQICTKNMLTGIVLCHMACLDVFFEQTAKVKYEQNLKLTTNFSYPPDPATGAQRVRCRLSKWPGFVAPAGSDPEAFAIDKATLQKLFISVNAIKSQHRKMILQAMNERTSDIMASKKPETLRRVLRELKMSLINEYCVNITFCTYQFACKYQAAALSNVLTMMCQELPQLNFFTIGSKTDMVRPAPRGAASVGEARRLPTCMITKNGRLDESRYLPHVVQIMQLDFAVKDKPSLATGGGKGSEGLSSTSASAAATAGAGPVHYNRTNFILSNMCRVLHHWTGISRLLRSIGSLGSPAVQSILSPENTIESWRSELVHIGNELDLLRDPADITSVVTYLYQAHSTCFLRSVASLTAVKFTLARYNNHKGSEKVASALRTLVQHAQGSSFGVISRQLQLPTLHAAMKLKTPDELLKVSPFVPPLARVKLPLTGDLETALADAELIPPASIPSHPDDKHFFAEVGSNGFAFIGDEVGPVYPSLEDFLLGSLPEDRASVANEAVKMDSLIEEARDEMPETLSMYGAGARSGAATAAFLLPHHDLLKCTILRDVLRELYFLLYVNSITHGWIRATKSQKASNQTAMEKEDSPAHAQQFASAEAARKHMETHLDDLFSRVVLSRGRVVYERELAERNEQRAKKKGRGHEREIRKRQVLLTIMEINKLLMDRTISEATVVKKQLEEAATRQESTTVALNTVLPSRTSIFSEFVTLVMSRALCTRSEGDRSATYHIPEVSLTTAMEIVGKRISTNEFESHAALCNASEAIAQKLMQQIVSQDLELRHLRHELDVLSKSIPRRVQASIADTKFDLLSRNGLLEKQLQAMEQQLRAAKEAIRDEVRVEYDERIADLQSQLLLSEDRFKSYKKKMARDMQQSLEEIKRQAMLNVGQMENAPLHMKRQALKIAISDDEVNTLKEMNAELKLAIVKTKLWYELKLMRAKAAYEKQLHDSTHSSEAAREQYWNNRQVSEAELTQLKAALSTAQHALSQSELEVEMLRKDLQQQLTNKKDLVASKVQSAKQVDELQRKLRKFEKWTASNIDLDKLVADYEQSRAMEGGGGGTANGGTATSHEDGGTAQTPQQRRATSAATDGAKGNSAGRPYSSSGSGGASSEEIKRLTEKYEKEKRLKEKAFAKIDEMRAEDAGTSEAMIWQRKFFEASSELQRIAKEAEGMRTVLQSHGIPYTSSSSPSPMSATGGSKNFLTATPTPARPPVHSAPLQNSSAATPQRPPPSKFPTERYATSAQSIPKGMAKK